MEVRKDVPNRSSQEKSKAIHLYFYVSQEPQGANHSYVYVPQEL